MIRVMLLGALVAIPLLASTGATVLAVGDGLDRNAYRQGNSTFAGQHIGARSARQRGAVRKRPRYR